MNARFREELSLPRRIVLLVFGVTGLTVILASMILIRRQEALFRNELESRSDALARSVAEYCIGPLAFDDHEGADAILHGLTASALVREAAIYDANGHVFASHSVDRALHPPRHVEGSSAVSHRFASNGLVVVAPIEYRGDRDGVLRLVVSTDSLVEARRQLLLTMAVLVVALLGISTLLASWLQRIVTRPLVSLADTMAVVARDARYDKRVATPRADEIGRLQSVFDELLVRLGRRERERDASEASLRALVAALPDVVLVLDSELTIVEAPVSRTIFDEKTSDVVGRSLEDAFPEDGREEASRVASDAIRTREIQTGQIELGEGTTKRTFEVVASPMPGDGHGETGARTILLVRDATERRSLEARTQQAEKLQAIGQLAGGIAHDFNNMLAVIMTNATLVDRVPQNKARQLLDDLRGAAQRASDLVAQLLAFARRKNAVRVRTDVNELVERVVRIVSRTVDPRVRIRAEFGATECFVFADVAQLESALINLALNARDAMPEGGDLVFSTRWVPSPEDESVSDLEISVADTGSGIPDDVLPHIFEPFFTTKPVGRGTGLGLSAVYGTVQALFGALTVDTEVGRGTTFHIRLPMVAAVDAHDSTPPDVMPLRQAAGRILFVEDDEAVRESTQFALQHAGFTVAAFDNGIDALAFFREHTTAFDVALVDNVMPVMTGRELIQEIRAIAPHLPILLCSGGDIEADETRGAARPDDFLPKPYRLSELFTRLEHLLGHGRAARARPSRPPSSA